MYAAATTTTGQVGFKPSQAVSKPSPSPSRAASLFVELVQRKPKAAKVGVMPGVLLLELELELTPRMQFGIIERQVRKVAREKNKTRKSQLKTGYSFVALSFVLTFCHGLLPVLLRDSGLEF